MTGAVKRRERDLDAALQNERESPFAEDQLTRTDLPLLAKCLWRKTYDHLGEKANEGLDKLRKYARLGLVAVAIGIAITLAVVTCYFLWPCAMTAALVAVVTFSWMRAFRLASFLGSAAVSAASALVLYGWSSLGAVPVVPWLAAAGAVTYLVWNNLDDDDKKGVHLLFACVWHRYRFKVLLASVFTFIAILWYFRRLWNVERTGYPV